MARKLVNFFTITGILFIFVAPVLSKEKDGGEKATASTVGMEMCLSCHSEYEQALSESPHRTLLTEDSAKKGLPAGCESCHGPGSLHLENHGEDIVNFKSKDGRDFAKQCLACHAANPRLSRWEHSDHNKVAVFCNACHKVHGNEKDANKKTKKTSSTGLCASCHKEIEAQFSQPSRHPVPERKMECVSCHNPHDENTDAAAFGSRNQTCVTCHTEKSGPFKYQHDPVAEDCLACHAPHGSASDKLVSIRVPNLCVQCHTDALLFHKKPSPTASIRNCLDCHKKIHGSNGSEKLLY